MTKSTHAYRRNAIWKCINFMVGENKLIRTQKKIPVMLIYMNRPRRGPIQFI